MDIRNCYFHDLFAYAFYFNSKCRRMEVYFDEYLTDDARVERSCKIVIQDWAKALSKLSSEERFVDIEENLGAVSSLLVIDKSETSLEMTVNTFDNRYVDYVLSQQQSGLKSSESTAPRAIPDDLYPRNIEAEQIMDGNRD